MDIDFSKYEKDNENEPKKKKPNKFLKYFLYIGIFFIVLITSFSTKVLISGQGGSYFFQHLPVVGNLKHLAESSEKKIKGEERGRINILLLGIGGKNHSGGELTDTIMLASIDPEEKKAALVSIPRDLTLPVAGMGRPKINSINAYAEQDGENGGVALSQALSDVLDMPIDYYVKADFQGFINIIDELGGVEVDVKHTLNDYRYPIKGKEADENYDDRYEHLYIEKGKQEMDGELALKYARSRKSMGAEGSDFARAERQQQIIQATKQKFQDTNMVLKPKLISDILNELNDHIDTNLKIWEIVKLWEIGKDIKIGDIEREVLDNSPNGLLASRINEEGAYILIPRNGDFSEIKYFIKNILSSSKENKGKEEKDEKTVEIEDVKISVRNGTWINGLASRTSIDLEKLGFEVIRVANSSKKNFETSVIYDLAFEEKTEALKKLKEETGANISFNMPEWLKEDIDRDLKNEEDPEKPDFILILGQSADDTKSGQENIVE
ncbi:MAG: LCP family protein [Patescibacteria group bacterium]